MLNYTLKNHWLGGRSVAIVGAGYNLNVGLVQYLKVKVIKSKNTQNYPLV